MIEVINVSSRGQIVIPEKTRKRFGIKTGSKLILLEKENTIFLKKEEDVARQLEAENKESIGWLTIAERSLKEIWDNPKDKKIWQKYL